MVFSGITENKAETPIVGEYDVVVCGGGPAGVVAAISAGRAGAKTLLIESLGCLGGTWTAGYVSWILDAQGKDGILRELINTLLARGAGEYGRGDNFVFDAEEMKLLLEDLCVSAGVDFLYYTRICGVVVEEKQLKYVVTESKSGRQAYSAKITVDATGDGDVAAYCGCGFDVGNENGETQPMSLFGLVTGVDRDAVREFNNTLPYIDKVPAKKKLAEEAQKAGFFPSSKRAILAHMRDELYMLVVGHQFGVSGTDVRDLTTATAQARRELMEFVNSMRSLGGIWKDMRLVSTAQYIGVREARRIHGMQSVTVNDLKEGTRHENSVCRASFAIDIHALRASGGYTEFAPFAPQPYDIPLGALVPRDVKGLLLTGRCISGDFIAHSSYRVTGNAAALGQAAGAAAALCAESGKEPMEIPFEKIESLLK